MGNPGRRLGTFGTTVSELKHMREWITTEGCTDVIMESTGSYWKPVFNILEGSVKVALANPHEVKARKGQKTDNKDAWWLAHLLRHGMVTPSFIPPRPQRELRDLTRRRRKMIQNAAAEKNRIGKVLEDANVSWATCFKRVWRFRTTHAGSAAQRNRAAGRNRRCRQEESKEEDS
jgi:transposase